MSTRTRTTTAIFTALPGAFYFVHIISDGRSYTEYYWRTYFATAAVLLGASLFFGFLLPPRIRRAWMWMLAAGSAALVVLTALHATPLCIGQDNGDGINDLSLCMGYVVLSAAVLGPIYLIVLAISAFTGQWALERQFKAGGRP